MGKLKFPNDYPWKPPAIMLTTDSGRFRTGERICLSISDYHPEQWNPVWPVRSIIIGLTSFMVTDTSTVGSMQTSHDQKMKISKESGAKLLKNKKFIELFDMMKENIPGLLDDPQPPIEIPAPKIEVPASKKVELTTDIKDDTQQEEVIQHNPNKKVLKKLDANGNEAGIKQA